VVEQRYSVTAWAPTLCQLLAGDEPAAQAARKFVA
jgi:hypothetical protein